MATFPRQLWDIKCHTWPVPLTLETEKKHNTSPNFSWPWASPKPKSPVMTPKVHQELWWSALRESAVVWLGFQLDRELYIINHLQMINPNFKRIVPALFGVSIPHFWLAHSKFLHLTPQLLWWNHTFCWLDSLQLKHHHLPRINNVFWLVKSC